MCGISVLCGFSEETSVAMLENLAARGPDDTALEVVPYYGGSGFPIIVGFTLLAVQGAEYAQRPGQEQPYAIGGERRRLVMCNGEIYNSKELFVQENIQEDDGLSDCSIVPELLKKGYDHRNVCRLLDGDFAIVDLDIDEGTITLMRDPYGVRPLFFAYYGPGQWGVSSELKGLPQGALRVESIIPGSIHRLYLDGTTVFIEIWHQTPWLKAIPETLSVETAAALVRSSLTEAVKKRLAVGQNRSIGACLSGGLDSSLVAAITSRLIFPERLHTFSVGMEGSEDLLHARIVSQHINSIHHELVLDSNICLQQIPTVIGAIESCDVTTVRASVGNYNVGLLAKGVDGINIRVLLNGDGADELFCGYLYMKAAPDDNASEIETTSLLENLHYFDVLRSERCMAANGLESRSPFLDRQLVSLVRSLPTRMVRNAPGVAEKHLLRKAFESSGLLPDRILWRRKEAFSDGMSGADSLVDRNKSWYAICREVAVKEVGEPVETAERRWYHKILRNTLGAAAVVCATPHYWMPKFVENATDPSARTLAAY